MMGENWMNFLSGYALGVATIIVIILLKESMDKKNE